mgnify:CR=1 FL=1
MEDQGALAFMGIAGLFFKIFGQKKVVFVEGVLHMDGGDQKTLVTVQDAETQNVMADESEGCTAGGLGDGRPFSLCVFGLGPGTGITVALVNVIWK